MRKRSMMKKITKKDIEKVKEWALENTDYLFNDETDVSFEKVKWVKCRKEHECVCCGKKIRNGETALSDTYAAEGEISTSYSCYECIESAFKEFHEDDEND